MSDERVEPGTEASDAEDSRLPSAWAELPPDRRRRVLVVAMTRALVTVVLLVTVYFLLPFDGRWSSLRLVSLALALVGLAALGTHQVRSIIRSDFPLARAIESLAVTVPALLLVFSSTYYLMARSDPSTFSQTLTRLDALYFTITVFATVGFGDITAVSQGARAVVTLNMAVNLLVLGIGIRVVFTAVRESRLLRQAD